MTTDLGVTAVGVRYRYPIGYTAGKKYPLVMDIHGGPISTSTRDLGGIESGELDQVLAARGYFVFRPNYRGSDNLGDAFLMAIVGDMASGPGKDNLAAVDALRKTGMIDESRIFVSGWSGGGLQTSWLVGHATFWRAAVSGAAVNDQYEQAVLSDINEPFNQAFFPNVSPFTPAGRAAYDAESPLTYVDAMKTPLLILSDTRDQRVPVRNRTCSTMRSKNEVCRCSSLCSRATGISQPIPSDTSRSYALGPAGSSGGRNEHRRSAALEQHALARRFAQARRRRAAADLPGCDPHRRDHRPPQLR